MIRIIWNQFCSKEFLSNSKAVKRFVLMQQKVMNLQEFNLRLARLTYPQNIQDYFMRESGYFPGTPRIYINSHNQQFVSLYVQKLGDSFSPLAWRIYSQITLLDKLGTIINSVINLRNKYGCFRIYQNLIKMNLNHSPRIWIHQDPTLNYRQFPLVSEPNCQYSMVKGLLKLFQPLIKQLNNVIVPECLHSLSQEIQRIKQNFRTSKRPTIQKMFYPERKSIKSFMEIQVVKPISTYHTTSTDDNHLSESSRNNSARNVNNCSFDTKKNYETLFQLSAKTSYNQSPHRTRDSKNKSISFTYSSPQSRGSHKQLKPLLMSPIQQYNQEKFYKNQTFHNQQFQNKEKEFGKSKFPHSTQSTLVTLKDTKSFRDMNFDLPIEEQQKSESNNKGSSKGKSMGESRCDIEVELENLFGGEKQHSNNNEEEFSRRELQFEEILFS